MIDMSYHRPMSQIHIEKIGARYFIFSISSIVAVLLISGGCSNDSYKKYIGMDARDVVREMDDDEHMIVWPRDETLIETDCSHVKYVTIAPKYPPSYTIRVKIDKKCEVVGMEKHARSGL